MIKIKTDKKGSSIIELIIVTMIFAILVPTAMGIFISGLKINGQGYVQHSAAITLAESVDIIRFMRSEGGFTDLDEDGDDFFLIRSSGEDSWLKTNDTPGDNELFTRHIIISKAYRNINTDELCIDYDEAEPESYPDCAEDTDVRKITIEILWAPSYIPSEIMTQVFFMSNWMSMEPDMKY